jgi:hypothetical protein
LGDRSKGRPVNRDFLIGLTIDLRWRWCNSYGSDVHLPTWAFLLR